MSRDLVQVARRADIAVISVDNPPVNTITAAVRAGLARGLDELAGLAGIKAVVLRDASRRLRA
jgi:3-hydroxyacyl-CoA dehydrogenase